MRLLVLSNFYPPHDIGGYEQWCQEVVDQLQQRSHQCVVLTSNWKRPGVHCPDEPHVFRQLSLNAPLDNYRPLEFFTHRHKNEQANSLILTQCIDEFDPELIFIWGMWNMSRNLPYQAEQKMSGRTTYFISDYWPLGMDTHEEYWQTAAEHKVTELLKKILRNLAFLRLKREGYPPKLHFQHSLCCSQYVRNTLIQASKLPTNAGVLYGGIDPTPFLSPLSINNKAQKQPLKLLYFGGLSPNKGVHTAIKAMDLLKQNDSIKHLDLTILGGGHNSYERQLQTMVAELNLEDKVHFVGRVARSEVPSWLKKFDVFLFTSIWPEPMARTVMEAMAAGLLVIGSEVGGQVEMLVDGQNSLTFQAEDAAGLANQIFRAVEDPLLRGGLAIAGQQMVLEKFTLDRMVNEVEQYLTSIIESHKCG